MPEMLLRRLAAFTFWLLLALPALTVAQAPSTQALAGQALAEHAPEVAAPTAVIRIGVATMLPGEIFWERFGHNAIVVDDPGRGEPISYNFGFFDLDEPGFIGRFVRGQMQYQLVALPFAQDLAYYRDTGRGVVIQWLDLDPAQAARLAAVLAENAKPQNARYDYDYFTDNCSTRVRDALDMALSGRLRPQLAAHARDNTYRSEAVRLASPAGWMWLGFDLGLGPFADRPLSLWQEAFVPMRLADGLRKATRADGQPLVASEQTLLPHRLAPEPTGSPRPWWPWLLYGLAIAVVVAWAAQRIPRRVVLLAIPWWTLCGVIGALMAFIWCCTAHRAGWSNQNLLLFNPLCLLLLPGAVRIARGRDPGSWFRVVLATIAVSVLVALALHWLPIATQCNGHWIALALPIHVVLWLTWRRHSTPRPE